MANYSVSVEVDHLAKLAGQPLNGIIELVWNALDADADRVDVEFDRSTMGGIHTIRVHDDGHGMTYEQAVSDFTHLGGSWKRLSGKSKTRGRPLHGQAGQGRWRAFGIQAERVTWETIGEVDGQRALTRVEIRRESLGNVEIDGPHPTSADTGTTVILEGISEAPRGLETDGALQRLTAIFALHIEKYRTAIWYDGNLLDPEPLQADRVDYAIEVEELEPATLTIIEWKPSFDRALYLCDPDGIALEEIAVGVHAPGYNFTGYLRWPGFVEHADELGLADMSNPNFEPIITAARDALRDHFRRRSEDKQRRVIEQWKQEQIYPYKEPAVSAVEETRRELFDLVAIQAAPAVNSGEDPRAKRLSLELLREAVDAGPAALRRVLNEVLVLPKARLAELNDLLDRTSLGAIIGSAKVIADRLDFLAGLEILLFEPDHKRSLKERSQLHKIVANETWIFGEEFALAVSDRSLTEALTQHIALMDRDYVALDEDRPADREVLDAEGKRRIVDLMLARAMEQNRSRREHLVVELKAPAVKLGMEEISQIQNYAFTVAADGRFNTVDVNWDFVLVSDDLDSYAEKLTNQSGKPRGLVYHSDDEKLRVWAKPWAEIIQDCRHRLKFVEAQLQYAATEEHAVEYLRSKHAAFLPDSLPAGTGVPDVSYAAAGPEADRAGAEPEVVQ